MYLCQYPVSTMQLLLPGQVASSDEMLDLYLVVAAKKKSNISSADTLRLSFASTAEYTSKISSADGNQGYHNDYQKCG